MYDYKPLKDGHIRVLDLLSQPGQDLRCRLRHVKLDDHPPYVALSYVWGTHDKPFSMDVVDDQEDEGVAGGLIALTTSLRNALQDLRDCEHFRQRRTFWIDQVCINQADDAEKGAQVAMMKHIYETAGEVVTYLGPEEPGDEAAIALLHRIHRFYDDRMRAQPDDPRLRGVYAQLRDLHADALGHRFAYATYADTPPELRFRFGAGDTDEAVRAAYAHLAGAVVSSAWADRTWLVQENVANRRAGFLRGPRHAAWGAVGLLCALAIVGLVPRVPAAGRVDRLHRLRLRLGAADGGGPGADTLYTNMFMFRLGRCADARDRIYAVLGLASDADELGVVPEYDKSPAQVYTDLAVKHVRKALGEDADDKLGVLMRGSLRGPPEPPFPSWVPTFPPGGAYALPGAFNSQNAGRRRRPPPRAPGEEEEEEEEEEEQPPVSFQSTPSVENGILVARGVRLPPLARALGALGDASLQAPLAPGALARVAAALDRVGDADAACASACRALLMDSTWPPPPPPWRGDEDGPPGAGARRTRVAAEAFRDLRGLLRRARDGDGGDGDGDGDGSASASRRIPGFLHLPTWRPAASSGAAAYVIGNSGGMAHRALWVSGGGGDGDGDGDMVLAPAAAGPGDVPVVLCGGRWVYFLRPSSSREGHDDDGDGDDDLFEYLGFGFASGFMNGEAFETEGWRERVETFRIK